MRMGEPSIVVRPPSFVTAATDGFVLPGRPALETAMDRLRLATSMRMLKTSGNWLTQENLQHFFELMNNAQLYAVFQPILDFNSHNYLGYEGLIRGPQGSPLHTPDVLFGLAQDSGLMLQFERLCRKVILRSFVGLGLKGRLFINVSVNALADLRFLNGETRQLLNDLAISPSRIVIEITENQKVTDYAALREVLSAYRQQGYQIAIDDLGEGFSSLRMWSEIHPEYAKIDRHFISGIADNPLKLRLVQAMRDIAESSHARLIAEGIENTSELQVLRDLGIDYGQGFLIECPVVHPGPSPMAELKKQLLHAPVAVFPSEINTGMAEVRQLTQMVEPIHPDMLNQEVIERFESRPEEIVLPVVMADGTPVGLINRYSMIGRFVRPFQREIYSRRPCTEFMNSDPICVDHKAPVQEVGQMLGRSDSLQMVDGFIITENGRYLGIGSSQSLMALITEMQIRAARYANPLTQLPGNVPINEHLDRLLERRVNFVACYCDLDHFKPFNDCYGYRSGDQLIQIFAKLLTAHVEPRHDFIGHVGGDDFIMLMQSHDWETRCQRLLEELARACQPLFSEEHIAQGGYYAEDRRGNQVFHPLPTLSIGALVVYPGQFHSHHEISAALSGAKKQAKKIKGNSLFVERRQG